MSVRYGDVSVILNKYRDKTGKTKNFYTNVGEAYTLANGNIKAILHADAMPVPYGKDGTTVKEIFIVPNVSKNGSRKMTDEEYQSQHDDEPDTNFSESDV